jgi:hypothetical protein
VLGRPAARLVATLLAPGQHPRFVARLVQHNLAAGSHKLSVGLSASYRGRLNHRHHLSVLLKLAVATASGQHVSLSRRLTLTA